jgi:hypothetical protein
MIQGGREKFNEYMKQIGQTLGAGYKGFADRFSLTANDAKSEAAIIPAMITVYWGSQQKFEIEEATVEKARVKCINCAFWNTVQAQKITDDLMKAPRGFRFSLWSLSYFHLFKKQKGG